MSAATAEVARAASDPERHARELMSSVRVPDRKALVKKLVRQIVAISRRSPMQLERAVQALGWHLGPEQHPTPYLTEWPLAPTDLIAGGTLVRMPSGIGMTLIPQPSLELAFQDFEKELLDLPYAPEAVPAHSGEEATVVVRAVYHMFRVKGGELLLQVPSGIDENQPNQIASALYGAFDTAKNRARLPVRKIVISDHLRQRWKSAPTLRELRKRK
jgi:hypothetical protein